MYLVNNAFPKWIGNKIRDETDVEKQRLRDRYGTRYSQGGDRRPS